MQPELTWHETNQQQLTKATRTAEELQYLLEEERARNAEMRMQYERQLKLIRSGIQKEKRDLKQTLVQQVDFIVRKYRDLATEAVETARQERQKVQTERIKARELAETACRNFEKDLKERTRKALEEYRQLAQEAHKAAQAEREELRTKCANLEKAMIAKRQQFDALVIRVEKECSEYDTAMLKAVAVFCKTKGVDVDESTLRQQLGDIRIQRLKESGQDSQQPNPRPLTVKYGFQAITPGSKS
ncbi:hypothetical protein, conserved [Eimeria praecox]|uniref:Uncharacterized protein n=1 Tax=Eimeria praecox TaxID=51316 RepID=U6H0K7_9EIME|nr:hypothetical protein, conserved [Eimeria praecox]